MDLLVKKFPDDVVFKLKIKALRMRTSLRDLIIKLLSKEADKDDS